MEEKEVFIKDSKLALMGVANGIFGSFIYELILTFLLSFILSFVVSYQNSGATSSELQESLSNLYDSYPFGIIISILGSLVVLFVFVAILKFNKIKEICKTAISSKAIKYGFITFLCIIAFSVLYNSAIVSIFDLGDSGNANQGNVIELIKDNAFLGFLLVVILAPLTEELTYRYCLFGGIANKKRILGYIISGIVFMFMHSISSFQTYGFTKDLLIDMLYLPPYLFSGLALCYSYEKSENLGSSFIAHLLNNLLSFLSIILV